MKSNFSNLALGLLLATLFLSCDSSNEPLESDHSLSIETTNDNAEKTFTSIKLIGSLLTNDEASIQNHGICWSTNPNPSIQDNFKIETNNQFSSIIDNLTVNTTYYFKVFANTESGLIYSDEVVLSTLDFNDTSWRLTTVYQNDFEIISLVDFYGDGTTRYDEMDLPLQCPGCFITHGSWSLDGNTLTYLFEGDDPNTSTYVYTGIINLLTITGQYTHITEPGGEWFAEQP